MSIARLPLQNTNRPVDVINHWREYRLIVHRFVVTSIVLLMLLGCESDQTVRGYESSDGTKVKFNPAKVCKPTDLVTSRAGHGMHGHRTVSYTHLTLPTKA